MKSLVVIIELRAPRTKAEKVLYGECVTDGKLVSRIFVNSRKDPRTRIDTFFHEMAHAYMHWIRRSPKNAEKVARHVGQAAELAFKQALA